MNELMFVLVLLICMVSIFCVYKLFPKSGLYMMLIILIVLSFIMSFKITYIFGVNVNLNVIPYTSIFAVIFILINTKDKKENKKIFSISILTTLFLLITILLSCLTIQTVSDTTAINMNNIFLSNYKLFIIYPITFLLEEYFWMKLYYKFYNIYESVFITSITNCILLGAITTVLFVIIGYLTSLTITEILNLILTIYLFKILLTLCYIPLMYSCKKKVKK